MFDYGVCNLGYVLGLHVAFHDRSWKRALRALDVHDGVGEKSRSGMPGEPSGLGMSTAADQDLHLVEMMAPRHRSSLAPAIMHAIVGRPHEVVEFAADR